MRRFLGRAQGQAKARETPTLGASYTRFVNRLHHKHFKRELGPFSHFVEARFTGFPWRF